MAHLTQIRIFWEKQYNFDVPLGPFHCAKYKKNPLSRFRVMTIYHFWALNSPFFQNQPFYRKSIDVNLMHLLPTFTVQNFEKHTLELIQSYKDTSLWDQNYSMAQPRTFFGKVTTLFWSNYCSLSLCKTC